MKFKIILATAGFVLFAVTGCACSKKAEVPPADATVAEDNSIQNPTEKTESQPTGNITAKGATMDWKYTNEVMIKSSDPEPIDKILELADKSENGRAEVYFQFEVKNEPDLQGLEYLLREYGPRVTTFEILVPPKMIKPEMPIRFLMPDNVDTRLIITGMGDKPLDLTAVTLNLGADTLVVRNFRFDKQEYRSALVLEVGKLFTGENLSFNNNKFEHHVAFMASPLVVLKSRANEGEASNYVLKNVSFAGNQSDVLLAIDEESRGKFERIELDHVVAKDNTNLSMGIDISATKEVFVHDCELTGSKAAPLLYQILPDPEVTIKDSKVSNRVYGYRPQKENWHTDAKPVTKVNLDEAEGTTYDKVP